VLAIGTFLGKCFISASSIFLENYGRHSKNISASGLFQVELQDDVHVDEVCPKLFDRHLPWRYHLHSHSAYSEAG
jgi:hypothetical protein